MLKKEEDNQLNKKILVSMCDSLFQYNENILFVKQSVSGDEKGLLYNKVFYKRS